MKSQPIGAVTKLVLALMIGRKDPCIRSLAGETFFGYFLIHFVGFSFSL